MQNPTENHKKIEKHLKINAHKRFYLREISKETGVNSGTTFRILGKLTEEGLINKQRDGNKVYFSFVEQKEKSSDYVSGLRIDAKKWLKKNEYEMVKYLQELIQIPSVSGEDTEDRIIENLNYKAIEFKLQPEVVYKNPRRPNLVVNLGRKSLDNAPKFLFLGHVDTVGVSDLSDWMHYPHSGHKSGGRIYGRGAADMKSGLVCQLFLMKMIKELQIDIPIDPRLIFVSNEEGGASPVPIFDIGMDYLIEQGYVEGIGAIYGYAGSYNVGIGHRGVLRMKIVVKGESVHTGSVKWQRREVGANAVTGMSEILYKLEKLNIRSKPHPDFPKLENVITPGTMIHHGGTAVSMVPDECESVIEVRYLPGFNVKEIESEIRKVAEKTASDRGLRVEVSKFVDIDAVCLSPDEKLVKQVKSAVEQVYKKDVTTRGYGPANESFMLIKKGIPTVVFGPRGAGAHRENEYVEINSLAKTILVYLHLLLGFDENDL